MHYPVFQQHASFCSPKHSRLIQVGIVSLALTALVLTLVHAPANSQAQPEQAQPEQAQSEQAQPGETSSPAASNARPTLRPGSEGEPVSELQAMLKLLGYYVGSVDGVYRASTAAAVSAFQQAVGLQADGIVGPATWNQLLPPSPNATTATVPTPAPAAAPAPTPAPATSPAPTAAPAASPAPTPAPAPSPGNTPTPAPTSQENAAIDLPVLRIGTRGSAVARLQERLNVLGFYDGAIDGVFGAETQAAVQAAQRSFDLEPDGVVGADTWTVLLR